jgi:hypothetical protein
MTDEQINAAIAKVLKHKQWYPNFATDLNAMHAAEKVLASAQKAKYVAQLVYITVDVVWQFQLCTASARQRAELA